MLHQFIRMNGLIVQSEPGRILERMGSLADATRSRLLLVLEGQEFTVSELCTVLRLPQSTVSRHLKLLADERWLVSTPDGTSRHYRMAHRQLDAAARDLWALVRERIGDLPAARQDTLRVRSVLATRKSRSQEFFAETAATWDEVRRQMFGDRADLQALLGLLDTDWVVGDLGCGTGRMSESLAPFVGKVIAVDSSREMLAAARDRLRDYDNVEVREGRLEAMPLADAELDAAVLFLVLHHIVVPEEAIAALGRVVRPGGRVLIADMTPHDRVAYRHDMGHAWLGFSRQQISDWLADAGFGSITYRELTPDPDASGPALFAASARRPG
jgi:ubiquinone/menaquinone biosynthesis C-methylase UbiE